MYQEDEINGEESIRMSSKHSPAGQCQCEC